MPGERSQDGVCNKNNSNSYDKLNKNNNVIRAKSLVEKESEHSTLQFAPCAEMCSVWEREYPLVRYLYHRQPITHLLYSKRAHRYFSASSDGLVKMWKPDYHSLNSFGKPVIVHEKNLLCTRAEILSMTLSPLSVGSAEVLLVMCNDGTITLIRTVSGEVLRTLLGIRTNNINDAKAIYERHPFKRESKTKSSNCTSNHHKNNEVVDNKCDTIVSNDVNKLREKDTNKQEQEELVLPTHALSNKNINKKEMSKLTNRERERELVQMSKVEARVLPYTIRAYHHDTVELCFGRSNKYFQGLPIVAPTYEHLVQPVYHTADLLFDYGKLITTHSKHSHGRRKNDNNESTTNSKQQVKVEQQRKKLNKEEQFVHSRQENWFATAIAITYHTSDGRHQNNALCNKTIHAQHETNVNTSCVEHDSIEAHCNNSTQKQTENSFMTSSEWRDGVYLFLGFADGLVQVYNLNEKWFSTSHLSSTRVDPPVAFYPVASLLVHEAINDHSSFLEQSRCNESAITMIVISELPESPLSSETSVKQSNSTNNNGNNEAIRDDYTHHQHHQNSNSEKNTTELTDITFHQLVFIGCKDNTISVRHFDRLHVPLIILGNFCSSIYSEGSALSSSSLNGVSNTSRHIAGTVNNAKSRNTKNKTSESDAKTQSHQIFGLSGHTKPITCYAWSNALELLVTGGRDYMLYFWSPRTSRPVRSIDCRAAHITDNNNKQDFMRKNRHSTKSDVCNTKNDGNETKKYSVQCTSDHAPNDHTDNCNTDDNDDTMTLQKHFVIYGFPINLSFVTRETNKTVTNEKDKRKMSENREGPLIWLLMLDNRHAIRIYDAADGTCLHTLLNENELPINTFTTPHHYYDQRHKKAEEENSENYKAKNYKDDKSLNCSNSGNIDCKHTDEKELSLPLLQMSKSADVTLESSMSSNSSNQTYTTSQEHSKQHSTHKFNKWQTTNTHALLTICYDTEFERLLLGGYCINVWNTIERVENKESSKANVNNRKENTRLDDEFVHEMPYNSENKEEQVLLQQKLSHEEEPHNTSTHDEEEYDLFNGTLPALVPPLRKRQTERWISSIHADMNGTVNIALPSPTSANHLHTTTNTTHNKTSLTKNVHVDDANMTSSYSNTIEYTDDITANHNFTDNVNTITIHKYNNSGNLNENVKNVKTNNCPIFVNAEQPKEHESTVTERFTDETSKPDKPTFTSPTPSFDFLSEVKEPNINKASEHNEYVDMSKSQSPCLSVNYRSVFNTQRVTSANNERQRRLGVGDVYRFTNNIMDDFDMNALNMANPFTLGTDTTRGDAFNATDHTSCTKLPHMFRNMEEKDENNIANNGDFKVDELSYNNNNNNNNNTNEDDDGTREGAAVVMHNAYLHRRRQEALQQIMKITRDDTDSVIEHKFAKNNICGKISHKKNATNDSKKKNDSYSKNNSGGIKKANRHMTLEERLLRFTIHDSHIRHHSHARHGKLLKQHRHAGLIKSKMKPYEVRRAIEAGLIHLASFTDFSDTGTSTVFFGVEKKLTKNKYRNHTSNAIISQSFVRDALRQRGDRTRVQAKNLHLAQHGTAAIENPERESHTEEQNASLEHADKYTSSLNDVAEKWLTSHSPISSFVECKTTSAHSNNNNNINNYYYPTDKDSPHDHEKNTEEEYEEHNNNNIGNNKEKTREHYSDITKEKEERSTLYKDNKDDKECDWYTRREMAAERRRHAAALWHPARVMQTLMNWNVEPIAQEPYTCSWEESLSEDEEKELWEEEEKVKPNQIIQTQGQHQLMQTPHKENQVVIPHFLPKLLTYFSRRESVKYEPLHEINSCDVHANLPFTENKLLTSRTPSSEEQEINIAYAISGKRTNINAAAATSTHENVALMLAEAEVERIEQQIEKRYTEKRKVKDELEEEEYEEEEERKKDEHMEEKGITHRNDAHNTTSFKKGKDDACDSTTIPSILPYKNGKNRKVIRIETFGQLKERINKKIDLSCGVCKPRAKFLVHEKSMLTQRET